jgi:hypothetical protein
MCVSFCSLRKCISTCVSSTYICITSIKDFTLIFREEHKLSVLTRMFGPMMEEVTEVKQGKEIPLQAWTGPKGSRRLRLPDF